MKTYSRRTMLKTTAMTTGAICTCGALAATTRPSDCCNTPDLEPESYTISTDRIVVDISKAASLAEPGFAAFISYPDRDIELIVVRSDVDSFAVLSRFCTHGRQVLSYNQKRGLLQCNNYNHSLFELNGKVFKGPAAKPLASFQTEFSDGTLTILLERS